MSRDEFIDGGDGNGYHPFSDGDPSGYSRYPEYERQYSHSSDIHDSVQNFIVQLQKAIEQGNVSDIQNLYETNYVKLSERFYSTSPWPDDKDIMEITPIKDGIFLILYKELYYRHIYAKLSTNIQFEHRLDSYYNYCDLFNYIVRSEVPISLELPNQWLWEIIDEFIYQFQSFSHFMLQKKSIEDIQFFKEHPKVWNVHSVLNVLHSLVDKSNISQQLKVYHDGGDPDSVAGEFGLYPLYKMLGYFSLVGLLRLHSLLGDYYQAIKVLEPMELATGKTVPACYLTTYYYVGFAYMMMRRYADAIRIFAVGLLYAQRTRAMFAHRHLVDQVNKQTDKMYILLAMCLALHPQGIDESVMATLRDKYYDKFNRLQAGEINEFEESFGYACPKFISPVPPKHALIDNESSIPRSFQDPFSHQLKVFKDEVMHQFKLPVIRSYLNLYTTMPISKLATFLEISEDTLITQLLCFKHKMKNMVWTRGPSGLDGEFQSGSDMDFYIDKDMIHIADTKVFRRYGDYFIRQIHKYLELNRSIQTLPA